ncbi:isocitrate lyase/phosphoenolpyruvate mutase family protein [Pseudonocardia yunnanensis]|uniref:Isocitrate lyase/phosphoenolpyruvate mutase family protein n=1 Tax=Pseudonocardia yunnanensis TaxID=58107 RepID=A0ABW4F2H3_9PSEU
MFLLAIGAGSGRLDETISRARAYRDAGADGIFAPGPLDTDALQRVGTMTGLAVRAMWLPGPRASPT